MRIRARLALREATAADHDAVDAAFAGFDLADSSGYRGFLTAQAAALIPVEIAVDRFDPKDVLSDWPDRRRAAAVLADLADLDAAPSFADEPPPTIDNPAAALGAIYVLEGSRLGGRLLARSVPPGMPRRFLDAGDTARWRTLIETLDSVLITEDQRQSAIGAARAVFARFADSAERIRKDVRT